MSTKKISWVAVALSLAACSAPTMPSGDGSPGDSQPDGGASPDGSSAMDASAGEGGAMDSAVDVPASDGGTSTDGASDAAPACPTYQSLCGGRCIPTSVDPSNCGGCGITCAMGQVCVSNGCTNTCPTGLTACGGTCADLQSDSNHCGSCATVCPAGQGCAGGRCTTAAILDPSGVMCAGGGPPVEVGGLEGGATRCAGDIATVSFRWAICSCRDLQMSAPLVTDGFDSSRGPHMPGQLGGSVGVNNVFSNSNVSNVGGSLWVGTSMGIGSSAPQTIRQELHLDGPLQTSNTFSVATEGFVNGNINTSSSITFGGALHVPSTANVASPPALTYTRLVREPVNVADPCDCTADRVLPIGNIVNFHATRNDNAAIGLDARHFESDTTPRRVDLPCGRYYFTRIQGSSPITIVAHGRTAIFIGGDIATSNNVTITLDPTASLDIFVAGSVNTSAPLRFGSPNYPALTRVYIGGTQGFQVSNSSDLGANFYVPNGPVRSSAPLEVFGAVFAGTFETSNRVSVHYDRQVLRAADECTPRIPAGDAGVPDAARPDGGVPACDSCRDCANQACVGGQCGMCRTSADCCAPLQCFSGRCVEVPG